MTPARIAVSVDCPYIGTSPLALTLGSLSVNMFNALKRIRIPGEILPHDRLRQRQ